MANVCRFPCPPLCSPCWFILLIACSEFYNFVGQCSGSMGSIVTSDLWVQFLSHLCFTYSPQVQMDFLCVSCFFFPECKDLPFRLIGFCVVPFVCGSYDVLTFCLWFFVCCALRNRLNTNPVLNKMSLKTRAWNYCFCNITPGQCYWWL